MCQFQRNGQSQQLKASKSKAFRFQAQGFRHDPLQHHLQARFTEGKSFARLYLLLVRPLSPTTSEAPSAEFYRGDPKPIRQLRIWNREWENFPSPTNPVPKHRCCAQGSVRRGAQPQSRVPGGTRGQSCHQPPFSSWEALVAHKQHVGFGISGEEGRFSPFTFQSWGQNQSKRSADLLVGSAELQISTEVMQETFLDRF